MTQSFDLADERDVATLVEIIRDAEGGNVSARVGVINILWSLHEMVTELEDPGIEIDDKEAEEILSELPTSFEQEVEE